MSGAFSLLGPMRDQPYALGERGPGSTVPVIPLLTGNDAFNSLVGYYPQRRMDSQLNPVTRPMIGGYRPTNKPGTKVAGLTGLHKTAVGRARGTGKSTEDWATDLLKALGVGASRPVTVPVRVGRGVPGRNDNVLGGVASIYRPGGFASGAVLPSTAGATASAGPFIPRPPTPPSPKVSVTEIVNDTLARLPRPGKPIDDGSVTNITPAPRSLPRGPAIPITQDMENLVSATKASMPAATVSSTSASTPFPSGARPVPPGSAGAPRPTGTPNPGGPGTGRSNVASPASRYSSPWKRLAAYAGAGTGLTTGIVTAETSRARSLANIERNAQPLRPDTAVGSFTPQASPTAQRIADFVTHDVPTTVNAGVNWVHNNWKPVTAIGGGLSLAVLLAMALRRRRKQQQEDQDGMQKAAADLSTFCYAHPLVAGFLCKCGEADLDAHEIRRAVMVASQVHPDVATAFEKAGTSLLRQHAIGARVAGAPPKPDAFDNAVDNVFGAIPNAARVAGNAWASGAATAADMVTGGNFPSLGRAADYLADNVTAATRDLRNNVFHPLKMQPPSQLDVRYTEMDQHVPKWYRPIAKGGRLASEVAIPAVATVGMTRLAPAARAATAPAAAPAATAAPAVAAAAPAATAAPAVAAAAPAASPAVTAVTRAAGTAGRYAKNVGGMLALGTGVGATSQGIDYLRHGQQLEPTPPTAEEEPQFRADVETELAKLNRTVTGSPARKLELATQAAQQRLAERRLATLQPATSPAQQSGTDGPRPGLFPPAGHPDVQRGTPGGQPAEPAAPPPPPPAPAATPPAPAAGQPAGQAQPAQSTGPQSTQSAFPEFQQVRDLVAKAPEKAQKLFAAMQGTVKTMFDPKTTPQAAAIAADVAKTGQVPPVVTKGAADALAKTGVDPQSAWAKVKNMGPGEQMLLWGGVGLFGVGLVSAMTSEGGVLPWLLSLLGIGTAAFTAGRAGLLGQGAQDLTTGLTDVGQSMFSGQKPNPIMARVIGFGARGFKRLPAARQRIVLAGLASQPELARKLDMATGHGSWGNAAMSWLGDVTGATNREFGNMGIAEEDVPAILDAWQQFRGSPAITAAMAAGRPAAAAPG